MIYETKYGTLVIGFTDSGIVVKSDFPFLEFEESFDETEIKKAKELFYTKKKEIEAIIKKIEDKKRKRTISGSELSKSIRKLVNKGFKKIMLYGPTGTGKTHSLFELCKTLKNDNIIDDFLLFTCSTGMEDFDFLGKFLPDESKHLVFHESEFLKYIRKAKDEKIAIILDEFNRVNSKALNILIPLLDEKDGMVRINNYINNEIIEIPADNLMIFMTANFGGSYSGTHSVDSAIINRIDVSIFVDYQNEIEEEIISYLDEDKKKLVIELRNFLRSLYKENTIEPFSTRDLKSLAILIEHVKDIKNADEIFENIKPIIFKLVKNDIIGYPDDEVIDEIKEFINKTISSDSTGD